MSLEFGYLRAFVSNYVFYSFGLILRYFFSFLHLGDAKKELSYHPPPQDDHGTESRRFQDSQIDGFPEELAHFLFWNADFHEGSETETESSVSMDTVPEGKTDCSVSMETHSDIHGDCMKAKVYGESFILKEIEPEMCGDYIEEDGSFIMESESFKSNLVVQEDGEKNGGEIEKFVSMETYSDVLEGETKYIVSIDDEEEEVEEIRIFSIVEEMDSNVYGDGRKINGNEIEITTSNISGINEDGKIVDENETKISDLKDEGSNFHHQSEKIAEIERENSVLTLSDGFSLHGDSERIEKEEETEAPVYVENNTVTTTSKCEYYSGKDISFFMEEPTSLRFSFREFYTSPDISELSDNTHPNPETMLNKVFSELDSEKDSVAEEETEDCVHSNYVIPIHFQSEVFGGTDSSDEEDYFIFNENSVTSDSESESSCSSGLIWGNNTNKIDDSISYQFLGGKTGFETEILKLMMREDVIDGLEEKQSSCDVKVSEFGFFSEKESIEMEPCTKDLNLKPLNDQKEGSYEEMACMDGKNEKVSWEVELDESESDEDDFEWEHDDLVEQLKMELKYSRQGGLATILEEEEEEEELGDERVSPNVVQNLKPLRIEEKLEYKDQIGEIEKVYKGYAEKMRKLDILNCQTMHALGLLQLKDPLKLISIPKSTIQSAKPIISHNLWPLKATKITSDPLLKLVNELHRDLELVYVGQICLSWDILCWQQKKALELQQYDSQGSHSYNIVAGEFQLFQVLMQRFIENEPFQGGPRIQNYVKNRCVIRNLLQVPAIKDDSKGSEEDAIASGRLADIIKESMRVFWEFVRADKDYGNVILKVSKQIGVDLKDPTISGLLVNIKSQLHKKERKLKDIVRSGNCIVKKFQKHHEDQLDHEQLVAQVGLRLISRVVNMSQLRKEQVLWCNEKLHRIKFLSRKIVQVEPSFLLFPC